MNVLKEATIDDEIISIITKINHEKFRILNADCTPQQTTDASTYKNREKRISESRATIESLEERL
jgi:hypothetical protein